MMKKRTLTPDEVEECSRLKAIYNAKRRQLGVSQETIAAALDITQSSVSHYLNATNALNLEVAVVFSEILKTPISEFSPRLAKQLNRLAQVAAQQGVEVSSEPLIQLPIATNPKASLPLRFDLPTLLENGLKPSAAAAFIAQDDSMAPEIRRGGLTVIDTTQTTLTPGDTFLFLTPAGPLLRRASRQLDGSWVLRADNPNKALWPDEPLTPELSGHITTLGRVTPMIFKPAT